MSREENINEYSDEIQKSFGVLKLLEGMFDLPEWLEVRKTERFSEFLKNIGTLPPHCLEEETIEQLKP